MGAVLTKHIQTAEIVTIEDSNPDKIDHFQFLNRIDAPILTISQEDNQKCPIITSN